MNAWKIQNNNATASEYATDALEGLIVPSPIQANAIAATKSDWSACRCTLHEEFESFLEEAG
jgi:hypothetical protein